jgi:hypothetical protein
MELKTHVSSPFRIKNCALPTVHDPPGDHLVNPGRFFLYASAMDLQKNAARKQLLASTAFEDK